MLAYNGNPERLSPCPCGGSSLLIGEFLLAFWRQELLLTHPRVSFNNNHSPFPLPSASSTKIVVAFKGIAAISVARCDKWKKSVMTLDKYFASLGISFNVHALNHRSQKHVFTVALLVLQHRNSSGVSYSQSGFLFLLAFLQLLLLVIPSWCLGELPHKIINAGYLAALSGHRKIYELCRWQWKLHSNFLLHIFCVPRGLEKNKNL